MSRSDVIDAFAGDLICELRDSDMSARDLRIALDVIAAVAARQKEAV